MAILGFGTFELDAAAGELRDRGRRVHLPGQAMTVLVLLLHRAGEIVTREELRRALWNDQVFVDFDRSLNFCIATVRRALNDDARRPRFIETIPHRGYRFLADVRRIDCPAAPARSPRSRSSVRLAGLFASIAIALAVQQPLGARFHTRANAAAAARAAFERGLVHSTQNVDGLRRSVYDFSEAIRLDARFAEAHYALADAYLELAGRRELPPERALAESKNAALQAVALENAPDSRQVLGTVRLLHDWDWRGARADLAEALRLAPRSSSALVSLARLLSAEGDDRAAIDAIADAETISPSCDLILFDAASIYYRARRYPTALDKLAGALRFGPPRGTPLGDWRQEVLLAKFSIDVARGNPDAARDDAVALLDGEHTRGLLALSASDAVVRFAASSARFMTQEAARPRVPPTRIATMHAIARNMDAAIEWLDRAAGDHDPDLPYVLRNPEFDPLAGDPRFDRLRDRVCRRRAHGS